MLTEIKPPPLPRSFHLNGFSSSTKLSSLLLNNKWSWGSWISKEIHPAPLCSETLSKPSYKGLVDTISTKKGFKLDILLTESKILYRERIFQEISANRNHVAWCDEDGSWVQCDGVYLGVPHYSKKTGRSVLICRNASCLRAVILHEVAHWLQDVHNPMNPRPGFCNFKAQDDLFQECKSFFPEKAYASTNPMEASAEMFKGIFSDQWEFTPDKKLIDKYKTFFCTYFGEEVEKCIRIIA